MLKWPCCDRVVIERRRFFGQIAGGLMGAVAPTLGWAQALAAPRRPLRVAAASDLKFALAQLIHQFQQETGIQVEASYGSSGNFARQIRQGLPVDLFMSADESWVHQLADAGLTQGPGVVYGHGRIALLLPASSPITLDAQLQGLQAQWHTVRKFAIANPEHAPYGRAAQQALQALGLWERAKPKLVLGENIAQATQFVTTGAAQAGISALSLARAPEVAAQSKHLALPSHLHAPLTQRMVLLKNAAPAAGQLFAYLQSEAARRVLQGFGFET